MMLSEGRGQSVEGSRSANLAVLGATLLALFALMSAFGLSAPASAATPEFELIKEFGPDGTSSSQFVEASSVAVDQSEGLVYILDMVTNTLFKFDLEGSPVPFGGSSPSVSGNELAVPGVEWGRRQVAVDQSSHIIYVTGNAGTAIQAFQPDGDPALFTSGPGAGTNEIPGFEALAGLAVDAQGMIFASEAGGAEPGLRIYTSSGTLVKAQKLFTFMGNIAVDSNGIVYNAASDGRLERFLPSVYPVDSTTTYSEESEPLVQVRVWGVGIDPATNEVYATDEEVGQVLLFDEEKNPLGAFGDELLEFPSGVGIESGSELAFITDWTAGVSRALLFQRKRCICAPTIENTTANEVSADAAKLGAKINPNSKDTTYWFEYGLSDCASSPCAKVPLGGASIGSGHKPVTVVQSVTGLQGSTLYHYRVVAENELGITKGPGRTFITQGAGLGFQLADSRAWELVSPPDKNGGMLTLPTSGIIQAAEDGNGLAYLSIGSIEPSPEGNRAIELSSVLARRGSGGWSSKDITPPHVRATAARSAEYKLMTPGLSRTLLEARDDAPLSSLTTERTPYLRENSDPPVYTPLLTTAEGHANVPPGTKFDQPTLDLMGANRELTVVALRSPAPLVAGAQQNALYAWRGGQIKAVSKLPTGQGGGVVSGSLGSGQGSVRNAVSDDGSRLFWSPGQGYTGSEISLPALYLRDIVSEETVRLDVVQPGGSGAGQARPAFQGASTDGTVVFFTDSRRLTANASVEGRDLYRCVIPAGPSLGGCATITDISASAFGLGESAKVKDQALAISDDGRRIYFVAEGRLVATPSGTGETPTSGEPNLYLWEEGQGTRFIATLSKGDGPNWGKGATQVFGYAGNVTADASPGGRYLAFMSDRSLTGYENSETSSGKSVVEAFRYDAVSENLSCVSCNPYGANPEAALMPASAGSSKKVDVLGLWAKRWTAATLPEARTEGFGDTLYRPRAVLDNGRIFFNAFDSLVPADSNREWDVYQYESIGSGSCTATSRDAATSQSDGGCVGLVSSGTGKEEAAFLDASLTGDDVFFLSSAKLSALDEDDVYDVYDARVGGVIAQRSAQTECQGEACQTAAQSPGDSNPASSSFQGRGNLAAGRRCSSIARRARKLQRRARDLNRKIHRVNDPRSAHRLRQQAKRLSRKSNILTNKAKRCTRANREAVR
jgi:DNA-binding beta-propeller fold protein YncE